MVPRSKPRAANSALSSSRRMSTRALPRPQTSNCFMQNGSGDDLVLVRLSVTRADGLSAAVREHHLYAPVRLPGLANKPRPVTTQRPAEAPVQIFEPHLLILPAAQNQQRVNVLLPHF